MVLKKNISKGLIKGVSMLTVMNVAENMCSVNMTSVRCRTCNILMRWYVDSSIILIWSYSDRWKWSWTGMSSDMLMSVINHSYLILIKQVKLVMSVHSCNRLMWVFKHLIRSLSDRLLGLGEGGCATSVSFYLLLRLSRVSLVHYEISVWDNDQVSSAKKIKSQVMHIFEISWECL